MKKYRNAVVIGRFQFPHAGHKHLIEEAYRIADKVTIVIGSANKPRSPRNPFTVEEREHFLKKLLNFDSLMVEELYDFRFVSIEDTYCDDTWASNVRALVNDKGEKTTLVGHYKDSSSFYLDMFPGWYVTEIDNYEGLSSSDMRARWLASQFYEVPDFIKRWEASYPEEFDSLIDTNHQYLAYKENLKKYERNEQTADAVVVQNGHVLLIKRGDTGLWALPGGFVQPNETVLECSMRELKEETQIDVPKKALISALQDRQGWRFDQVFRDERARIITTAFLYVLPHIRRTTKVKGSDDAVEAKWVTFNELKDMQLYCDHKEIAQKMIGMIK
jgi:bifunctional NMN adenylyltransferase/nudix hydrolase